MGYYSELDLYNKECKNIDVKQLSIIFNVSQDVIKNCVRRILPGKMVNGVKTFFTKQEASMISKELKNNSFVNKHLSYEVSSQVQKMETEIEIIENAQNAFKKLLELKELKIQEKDKIIQEQQQQLLETQQENIIYKKKQDDYNFQTQKRQDHKELFTRLNRAIRKYAIKNNILQSSAYRHFYNELEEQYCFNEPVRMDKLKKYPKYAKELLDMVLKEL